MLLCSRAEIREAFRVLDRDGNGFISKQELGMAMRSLGYMPSEVELAIIMQRLDMDGEDTHSHTRTQITTYTQYMRYHNPWNCAKPQYRIRLD